MYVCMHGDVYVYVHLWTHKYLQTNIYRISYIDIHMYACIFSLSLFPEKFSHLISYFFLYLLFSVLVDLDLLRTVYSDGKPRAFHESRKKHCGEHTVPSRMHLSIPEGNYIGNYRTVRAVTRTLQFLLKKER